MKRRVTCCSAVLMVWVMAMSTCQSQIVPEGFEFLHRIEKPEAAAQKAGKLGALNKLYLSQDGQYLILKYGFKPTALSVFRIGSFEHVGTFAVTKWVYQVFCGGDMLYTLGENSSAGKDIWYRINLRTGSKMMVSGLSEEVPECESSRDQLASHDGRYVFHRLDTRVLDVYALPPLEFDYAAYVYDYDTGMPIEGASVTVTGSDGESVSVNTDDEGGAEGGGWSIGSESTYSVDISKEGYISAGDQFSTIGLSKSTNFIKEYLLRASNHSSLDRADEKISGTKVLETERVRVRISEDGAHIRKVAVIAKSSELCDGTIDDGEGLVQLVEGELLGIYSVVERNHLNEVIREQELGMSGLVFEDADFARAGCLAGAQGTVLASYGCLQDETKIQLKMVDCSTSELFWSAVGVGVTEFQLMDQLREALMN